MTSDLRRFLESTIAGYVANPPKSSTMEERSSLSSNISSMESRVVGESAGLSRNESRRLISVLGDVTRIVGSKSKAMSTGGEY